MQSKATAALLRLKEMDRKYNFKYGRGKLALDNVSTESSPEDSPKTHRSTRRTASRKTELEHYRGLGNKVSEVEIESQVTPKSRVDVRIPLDSVGFQQQSIADESLEKLVTESNESIKEDEDISKTSLGSTHQDLPRSPRRNPEPRSTGPAFEYSEDMSEAISDAALSVQECSSQEYVEKSIPCESVGAEGRTTRSQANGTEIEAAGTNDMTEIISELSLEVDKNVSSENTLPNTVQEDQYEDDTFEEASTSSGSSSSAVDKLNESFEKRGIISGIRQIKITPHKEIPEEPRIVVDEGREKEIVELLPPKVVQSTSECDIGLDQELSNYVRTTEDVDQAVPISLLKTSRQTTPRKHCKRNRKHRKSSNENTEIPPAVTDRKYTEDKGSHAEDEISERNSWSRKSDLKEPPTPDEPSQKDLAIERVEAEVSSEEKLLRVTPKNSDVIGTLRNLNKDAINAIVRRQKIPTSEEVASRSKRRRNTETIVQLPPPEAEAADPENATEGKDHRIRRPKTKKCPRSMRHKRTTNSSKAEAKHSRFEYRQTHRLRRYTAAIRLEQERRDIRNYLLELERTRLEFGPGSTAASSKSPTFKPLEFPKIVSFLEPECEDSAWEGKEDNTGLQERLIRIRQRLKEQYIIYRDYSSLARTTNAKYIPASLEDAKRTIRQLQRATIKSK